MSTQSVNAKSDELPTDLDRIIDDAYAPPLVLDLYLTRGGIIRRIADRADLDIVPGDREFTHEDLAHLYVHAVDTDKTPADIQQTMAKWEMIDGLGGAYGFRSTPDQESMRKSQLIFILMAEVTGTRPDGFSLPSDEDFVYANRTAPRHTGGEQP